MPISQWDIPIQININFFTLTVDPPRPEEVDNSPGYNDSGEPEYMKDLPNYGNKEVIYKYYD